MNRSCLAALAAVVLGGTQFIVSEAVAASAPPPSLAGFARAVRTVGGSRTAACDVCNVAVPSDGRMESPRRGTADDLGGVPERRQVRRRQRIRPLRHDGGKERRGRSSRPTVWSHRLQRNRCAVPARPPTTCSSPPESLGLLYLSAVKTITENHIRKERCSENISNSTGCRARGQRDVG